MFKTFKHSMNIYIYIYDDSLILQNERISNKAIEKEEIIEGVSKQNGVDINLSSIWS